MEGTLISKAAEDELIANRQKDLQRRRRAHSRGKPRRGKSVRYGLGPD